MLLTNGKNILEDQNPAIVQAISAISAKSIIITKKFIFQIYNKTSTTIHNSINFCNKT